MRYERKDKKQIVKCHKLGICVRILVQRTSKPLKYKDRIKN